MTNTRHARQILETLRHTAQHSAGRPIQVDTVSRITGTTAHDLQPILNALFDAGELRELIGDKLIQAVVLAD